LTTIRQTRQREAIRKAFIDADRPLSQEEALAIAKHHHRGLGIATVYRNIKSLVEDGWLIAIDLPGEAPRFEVAGKKNHHPFGVMIVASSMSWRVVWLNSKLASRAAPRDRARILSV